MLRNLHLSGLIALPLMLVTSAQATTLTPEEWEENCSGAKADAMANAAHLYNLKFSDRFPIASDDRVWGINWDGQWVPVPIADYQFAHVDPGGQNAPIEGLSRHGSVSLSTKRNSNRRRFNVTAFAEKTQNKIAALPEISNLEAVRNGFELDLEAISCSSSDPKWRTHYRNLWYLTSKAAYLYHNKGKDYRVWRAEGNGFLLAWVKQGVQYWQVTRPHSSGENHWIHVRVYGAEDMGNYDAALAHLARNKAPSNDGSPEWIKLLNELTLDPNKDHLDKFESSWAAYTQHQ